MAKAIICDLDEILETPRIVKLTEKVTGKTREIDVTSVPTVVILELMKREKELKAKVEAEGDDLFEWMIGMAIKICKPSFPEITRDWIIENMSRFEQLQKFLQFTLQPINEYIDKAAESAKKALAAQETIAHT